MDSLYFVVHTHWDREWYQPFQQMRARLVAMADRMIPLVERGTISFFHFDGQTLMLELRPFEILTFDVRSRRAPKINSSFDRQKD
jgi:alpha-mannosidase